MEAMVAKIKAEEYQDALSIADQILKLKPENAMVQEMRKVLAEKVSLDNDKEADETDEDDSSSESDSESDQEHDSDSEEAATQSESSSDTEENTAAPVQVPACDILHVTADHKALSVEQRKQLRAALKDQLDDLKVEQAAQKLHVLGL